MMLCNHVWSTDGLNGARLHHQCVKKHAHTQESKRDDAHLHVCRCDPITDDEKALAWSQR